jgi:predicted Zn-dependent protease
MARPRSLFQSSLPDALASRPTLPDQRPRFLSEADCHEILQRLARFAKGGGFTAVKISSTWTGNVRWARNQISTAGEVSDNSIDVTRNLHGARGSVQINDTTDAALVAAARQAERLARFGAERPQSELVTRRPFEPYTTIPLFMEATYQLDADRRSAAAIALTKSAAEAGMLSAGYIEVIARGVATIDTLGRTRYTAWTRAQCSMTVRDPSGFGSGWAGDTHVDWTKIDGAKLAALALDKCLKSRNPVKVEPGRYTTILEPQAVRDFLAPLMNEFTDAMGLGLSLDPTGHGRGIPGPFFKSPGLTYLGERVVDERITISTDPMDPELGIPPFTEFGQVGDPFNSPIARAATWIEQGVLVRLATSRDEGIDELGSNVGYPNNGGFRMSGGATSMDEMIATTKRGVLVTRLDQLTEMNFTSQLYRGYTRDGLWLIENGKISKAVKNMVFTESILFALNAVEQLGVPQRVFSPGGAVLAAEPAIVPALKIRDFSFTALTDAI